MTTPRTGTVGTNNRNAFINDVYNTCMAKPRKPGAKFTTIAVSWEDKNIIRRIAIKKKTTKRGDVYESDAEVLHRMLIDIIYDPIPSSESHSTYPSKPPNVSPPG